MYAAHVEWGWEVDAHGGMTFSAETDPGDISFEAIFLAGVAPNARDMYAAGAYQNLTGVERCGTRRGVLDARMRGILLLRFDNSYSWTRRKAIRLTWSTKPLEILPEGSPRAPQSPVSPGASPRGADESTDLDISSAVTVSPTASPRVMQSPSGRSSGGSRGSWDIVRPTAT